MQGDKEYKSDAKAEHETRLRDKWNWLRTICPADVAGLTNEVRLVARIPVFKLRHSSNDAPAISDSRDFYCRCASFSVEFGKSRPFRCQQNLMQPMVGALGAVLLVIE